MLTVEKLQRLWPDALRPMVGSRLLLEESLNPAAIYPGSWEVLLRQVKADLSNSEASRRPRTVAAVSPRATAVQRATDRVERTRTRALPHTPNPNPPPEA